MEIISNLIKTTLYLAPQLCICVFNGSTSNALSLRLSPTREQKTKQTQIQREKVTQLVRWRAQNFHAKTAQTNTSLFWQTWVMVGGGAVSINGMHARIRRISERACKQYAYVINFDLILL